MKIKAVVIALFVVFALLPVGAMEYSGTLPVIHIDTQNSITSKTEYVEGCFYMEVFGTEEFEPLGSAENPLPLLIRGRGNWTWYGSFEKKSYKIKLETKMPLLGMSSNKHYALLAHADGSIESYYRNVAGFELGRLLGLEFTPHYYPVEVVLNGDYIGLYFLTETVRVDKGRVNIVEQKDYETDPELITGGWLIEIDNAIDSQQIIFNVSGTELEHFFITYHSPENLSNEQFFYLRNEIEKILKTVYVEDKNSTEWEDIIDIDVLTRFYLVHEILDNIEGFLGSCYLHKDLNEHKWKFGPLWDLGHAFNEWHPKEKFIYDYDNGWEPCIMKEIAKFPRFQEHLKEVWLANYKWLYEQLDSCLVQLSTQISQAVITDRARWPLYGTPSVDKSLAHCRKLIRKKRVFLTNEWGGEMSAIDDILIPYPSLWGKGGVYDLQGRRVGSSQFTVHSSQLRKGVYIVNGKKIVVR